MGSHSRRKTMAGLKEQNGVGTQRVSFNEDNSEEPLSNSTKMETNIQEDVFISTPNMMFYFQRSPKEENDEDTQGSTPHLKVVYKVILNIYYVHISTREIINREIRVTSCEL